jgi:hypothetical protein
VSTLLILYGLGLLHAGFAGFREAAGRNLRIRKAGYFVKAVLRGVVLGQAAALIIFAVISIMYFGSPDGEALLATLGKAGESALAIYLGYTSLVLLAFVPYAFPSVEVRSLTIVAVFGPLTLMLPLVMLAGAAAAIVSVPRAEVAILFASSIAAVSLVEPALAHFGFSKREAARARGAVDA